MQEKFSKVFIWEKLSPQNVEIDHPRKFLLAKFFEMT